MLFNLEEINAHRMMAYNTKHAGVALDEAAHSSMESFSAAVNRDFDIFLSYSSYDAGIIERVAEMLRKFGHSVYLDRQIDPKLDRSNVTRGTAEQIRNRLNHSRCLFYAASHLSQESKWMPWEAGYMDAKNRRVAILPIAKDILSSRADVFHGQEYLSLYPYISKNKLARTNEMILWTNESEHCYCTFTDWLKGSNPTKR